MCLESLKFWRRPKQGDAVPSSGTANPDQCSTSPVPSTMGDANLKVVPRTDISPNISADSTIPSQALDSTLDCSQNVLSTDVTVSLPTSPSQNASSEHSSASVQGRLWDQAYKILKSERHSAVEAYEKLLLEKLKEIAPQPTSSPDHQITAPTLESPEQLKILVNAGLDRSEKIAKVKANIEEFNRVATPVKAVMDIVVQAAPQAAIAWSCISLALGTLANPLTESSINRQGIIYVLEMMKWYSKLVDPLLDRNPTSKSLRDGLEKQIIQLYRSLLLYQINSVCQYYRIQIVVLLRDLVKLDDWAGELKGVKDAEVEVRKKLDDYSKVSVGGDLQWIASSLSTLKDEFDRFSFRLEQQIEQQIEQQRKRNEDVDNKKWLEDLWQTDPRKDRTRIQRDKGGLLRDSYCWIMKHEKYKEWYKDPQCQLLWIRGDPGKGKTMLLCGIIDELEMEPSNTLSYFFCQATRPELSNASSVLRGLMYGLVCKYPQLIPDIRKKFHEIAGRRQYEDDNSWDVLSEMLEYTLHHRHLNGVVLIVDALDECVVKRPELLEFIKRISSQSRVSFIVSSRNSAEVQKKLDSNGKNTSCLTLEENRDLISAAVAAYIERQVENLARSDPYKGNPKILAKVKGELMAKAENTFLWVALVCIALNQPDVEEYQHVIDVLRESPRGIEDLYRRMFRGISLSRYAKLSKEILAVTSVLKRPPTLQELCSILNSSPDFNGELDTLRRAIRSCGSFLNLQQNTVEFIHQSAVDFLKDPELEGIESIQYRHSLVLVRSLEVLRTSVSIKRNVYGPQPPDILRDDIVPLKENPLTSIKYCCIYWMDHLCESNSTTYIEDDGLVHQFFKVKFLYWLEALALLRHLPQAVQGIQKLQTLLDGKATLAKQGLSQFVHDANQFLLHHRVMIEDTPLQLYASALIFSPEQSVVRNCFRHEAPEWVSVIPGLDATWGTCLQTLFGHEGTVNTVAHSPDGQWLASGDSDGVVKLWQVDSGTCEHTIVDHDKTPARYRWSGNTKGVGVLSVAFSADGKSFVSTYLDGLVKVWDMNGNCVRELRAHSEAAITMAISADSSTIAYVLESDYYQISVQSTKMEIPSRIFEDRTTNMDSVSLTADGQWLASAYTGTITIWNTLEKEYKQVLHTGGSSAKVKLSPDGQLLASGSDAVRLYERRTGELISECEHDNISRDSGVWSMAFSDDGKLLAASFLSRVYVWNTMTGTLTWKSEGWEDGISSLSFSPDAQRIVSGSHKNIKVWDLTRGNEKASGSRSAQGLCYSDEHHFTAYYPDTHKVIMWDDSSTSDVAVKEFHEDDVSVIALSKDHQKLASAPRRGKITIRDTITGANLRTFLDDTEYGADITSLVFRDNFQLASGGFETIEIWNTSDGTITKTHEEKFMYIVKMTFSTNGRWLAYASSDNDNRPRCNLKIWDTATGDCCLVSSREVDSLSFSADSRVLAWASLDSIYLWDVTSGTCTRGFRRDAFHDFQVSFDANIGRRLHTQFGFLDFAATESGCSSPKRADTDWLDSDNSSQDFETASGAKCLGETLCFNGYGFSCDLEWLVQDGQRLLRIPLDHRAETWSSQMTPVINESTLIWISRTGRLVRMHLTEQR